MGSNRKVAITVGVLFIIGTVAGILSLVVTGPILEGQDYLSKVAANENQLIVGALFVLIMGFALAMVPIVIFPLLKKYNEALALGYVVFRGALETFIYIIQAIGWLSLLILSKEFVKAGTPDTSYFKTSGTVLMEGYAFITAILEIVFPLGALMFYYLLYKSNLIPRWLSGWGFIAAILYLAAGLYNLFGPELELLLLPLGVQEMVMAVWLIVKGFKSSPAASGSAEVDLQQKDTSHRQPLPILTK